MKLQFEPPRKGRNLTAFTRQLVDEVGEFSGALLQFTDWNTDNPDEMAMIGSLRRSNGEERCLIDAPGHLFASKEAAEAIGHCYLAIFFDWSAYLYLTSGAATFFFWEGDLIDFWCSEKNTAKKVCELVERYELRIPGKRRWRFFL